MFYDSVFPSRITGVSLQRLDLLEKGFLFGFAFGGVPCHHQGGRPAITLMYDVPGHCLRPPFLALVNGIIGASLDGRFTDGT